MCDEGVENNIHIDYEKEKKLYHLLTAGLAAKYGPAEYGKVLDYGCGVGHCLVELKRLRPNYQFCVADAYSQCIEITASRVGLRETYLVEDNKEVQIVDHGFDIIILSHVIEHTRDPLQTIENCRAMLKDGGILVLAAPNVLNIRGLVSSMFRAPQVNQGHLIAWDLGHWKNLLENYSNMEVLEYSHDEAYIFNRLISGESIRKKIEVFIGGRFPSISFSHLAVLRK